MKILLRNLIRNGVLRGGVLLRLYKGIGKHEDIGVVIKKNPLEDDLIINRFGAATVYRISVDKEGTLIVWLTDYDD